MATKHGARAVVFDLDGTLVDSLEGITASVNWLFERIGKAPLPKETVAGYVGEGARALFRKLFKEDTRGEDPGLFEDFIQHYTEQSPSVTPFFPGAKDVLLTMRDQAPVVLFTNKPLNATRTLLDTLGAWELFNFVVCPEHCRHRKPHPDGFLMAANRLGLPPAQLLMVGDARPDAQLAYLAGAPFLPVNFGYGRPGFYRGLPHLRPLSSFAEWAF